MMAQLVSELSAAGEWLDGCETAHQRTDIVGELARASEHLTLVVRAVLVLDLLGHGLHLVNGMGDTDKIAPSDAVQGVARSAHLAVNLVPSPDAGSPHETRQEVT